MDSKNILRIVTNLNMLSDKRNQIFIKH